MNHADHVNLLRDGVRGTEGVWADLGSGGGAFTLALADLLGPKSEIYSIDKDQRALKEQERAMQARFPQATVHYRLADFNEPLALPALDGLVIANALHYQQPAAREPLVQRLKGYLRPGARLIVVEYNVDRGNVWVPYPLSYRTWAALARQVGFTQTRLLATVPSRFLREIYSALSRCDE